MSGLNPVHREVTVTRPILEVRQKIMGKLQTLGGKMGLSQGGSIEFEFGSLLISKLLGQGIYWQKNLNRNYVSHYDSRQTGFFLGTAF